MRGFVEDRLDVFAQEHDSRDCCNAVIRSADRGRRLAIDSGHGKLLHLSTHLERKNGRGVVVVVSISKVVWGPARLLTHRTYRTRCAAQHLASVKPQTLRGAVECHSTRNRSFAA